MAAIGSTALGTFTPCGRRGRRRYHRGLREVRPAALDAEPDLAVVEQEIVPRHQHGEDLGVGQATRALVAGLLVEVEAEGLALVRPIRPSAKRPTRSSGPGGP
jgi:hypothetical protein